MPSLYCVACNVVFSVEDDHCPRCGMAPLSLDGTTANTVIFPSGELAEPTTDVQVDEVLLDGQSIDIYECQQVLGRGGMGIVYLARNTQLHRQCALKILSPKRASRFVDYVERFENEGRAAAALVHPNIVTTHAIGRTDQYYFLEMEFVPGQSLQREIDQRGPVGPVRATQMSVGIAEGLAMAHRLGIIHRDLKPDNVLVTPAGYPKIVDFGLAKQIQSATLDGTRLAGTPHFMAPELLQGAEATPASDVYALGVCFYLMLTAQFPFEGSTINSLAAAILTGEYRGLRRHNPDIPMDVSECVAQMLSREPDQRPQDGTAASQLLQAVQGSSRDLDTLVFEAFHDRPAVSWTSTGSRVQVDLKLPEQRRQRVFVENSSHQAGDRLLNIYSVCCAADPAFYEEALRLNSVVLHGGLAIRDIDGQPCFVMVDTYPRATVSAEEIRRSVIEVGSRADAIERLLTGRDVH
ncbi:MAG: serine/threonine-protein kinase [Planctomycetaceae bacterium]